MRKMIDIPDAAYARPEQQARARGVTVPQTIAQYALLPWQGLRAEGDRRLPLRRGADH